MQIPEKEGNAEAKEEVSLFVPSNAYAIIFDSEPPKEVFERIIPIIKKRKKRRKGLNREITRAEGIEPSYR
jgi:broad-specificity NMP kinase